MAYAPHTLFAFGGSLNATVGAPEIWQCGVRLCAGSGGILSGHVPDLDAVLASLEPLMATWWQDPLNIFPASATLNWLKLNDIDPDGSYTDPDTRVYDYPTGLTGGVGGPQVPQIMTACISWVTAAARGPASKGRIYPPNYSLVPAANGSMYLGAAGQTALLREGITLMAAITNALGANDVEARAVVASRVNGMARQITAVRAGSRFDVQRRRSDAIPEVYTEQTIGTG